MYKAKQRLRTLLLACFAALVSMFLAVALWAAPTNRIDASAAEQTETVNVSISTYASANGWKDSTKYTTLTMDSNITVTVSGGSNTGKYYTNGTNWRIYQTEAPSIKLQAATDLTIQSATFTYSNSNNGILTYGGKQVSTGTQVSINANSATFGIGNTGSKTNGQVRITAISVTYTLPSSEPACEHANTTEDVTLAPTCTEKGRKTITCNDCGNVETVEIPALGHNYVNGSCSNCGKAEPNETTESLNIYATTGVLNGTASISWTGTNIQLVSTKGSTPIRTSDADHFRAYADSKTTISTLNGDLITKIVITTISSDPLSSSTADFSNATISISGTSVIFTLTQPAKSFLLTAKAQWRLSKIEVTYEKGCEHTNTTENVTLAPTCTEEGSKDITCTACGNVETVTIPATGHTYGEGVITPPTTTDEGYTTYSCTVCGHSYQDDFQAALGATKYVISFSTPSGVASVESQEIAEGLKLTFPTAQALDGYTFLGWVKEEYATSSTLPTEGIYYANDELEITGAENFYALYSFGEISWKLVTDSSKLTAGSEIVIVANGSDFALSTEQKTNNRGQVAITKSGNTAILDSTVQIITLEAGSVANTFALNVGTTGYLYAASSTSNQLKTQKSIDGNASWNIEINSDGIATIKAQGSNTRNWLMHNKSSNLFSCYASNSMDDISIYAKSGAVYYTTSTVGNIESASVSLGSDVKLNYYVSVSDAVETVEMKYYVVGNETEEFTAIGEKVGNRWKFSLNVAPQAMTDVFKVQIVSDGLILDEITEYSVQAYANNKLNAADSSKELKQLITDMLYYGAAAQNYKGYNLDKLATDGVENLGTPSTAIPDTTDFTLVNNDAVDSYPAYFTGATVYFDGVNKLRVKINTTENVTVTINGVEVAVTGTTIETEGIVATEFNKKYTFVLYHNNGVENVEMQTLTYSVNAYAYSMKEHENAKMKDLALALYNYGLSAKAYANPDANA